MLGTFCFKKNYTFRQFRGVIEIFQFRGRTLQNLLFSQIPPGPRNKCDDFCVPLYSYSSFEFCEHVRRLWEISELTHLYSGLKAKANIKGCKISVEQGWRLFIKMGGFVKKKYISEIYDFSPQPKAQFFFFKS